MRKVKLFLLMLVALLGTVSASAKTVYIQPNANWLKDGARFALYMYGGASDAWTDFAVVDATNNIYKATFDDSQTNMIFCRMNGTTTENNWGNKWNQTNDLAAPANDNQLYTLADDQWDGATVGNGLTITENYTEPVAAGYTVDFNTEIFTNNHDFKVAPGWLHIVDSKSGGWGGTTYVNYVYSSSNGVDGSGCLSANTNQTTNSLYDLLVTPEVNGTVSLDVKCMYDPTNYDSSVKFFYVTEENGVLTRGEEIALTGTQTNTEFNTVSFTLTEATRVGIWINRAYIDNFKADDATIVLQPALTIASATSSLLNEKVYEDANGNITFTYTVTVTNTGERELVAGEDNYSVSIVNYQDVDNPVGTTLITQNLAVGETSNPIEIVALYPLTSYPNRSRFDAKENISNTTKIVTPWVDPVAYKPEFVFCTSESNSALESGVAYAFGKVNQATDVTYRIRNTGGAPLTINSITFPTGYNVDVTGPFEVAAGGEQQVKITLWSETPGSYSGNVVISYVDADAATQTFNLAVSGLVLDPTKWYATFNDEKFPAGTMHDSSWETAYSTTYTPNAYFIQNGSATTDMKLFITPLLHATANEELMFDAARRSTSIEDGYHLGVYYSTDRENWTLIRNIANNEFSTVKASSSSYSDYQFTTFSVNIPVEGDVYVGFSAGYVRLDNIYGLTPVEVDHDILFNATLPTEGTTNYDVTVKATVNNLLAKTETADSYTLKYYVGGEVAAEATTIDLTTGVENAFNIAYTPRTAGTFETKLVLELNDGKKYESEPATLIVTEEVPVGLLAIGDETSTSSSQNVPVVTNYTSSQSEFVYLSDEINLPVGTAINSIAFKGYRTSAALTIPVQVWIEETTDEVPTSSETEFISMAAETKYFDGEVEVKKAGTLNSFEDVLTITLAKPFTYQGGNLRIVMQSTNANNGQTNFQNYSKNNAKYRRQDKSLAELSASFSSSNNPVMYVGFDKVASTFSGKLTMDNNALANVTVTLTSGNVMYSGKTDANGDFNFKVLQDNKTYTITTDYAEKSYFPFDDQVTFAGTSVVKNINLTEAADFYIENFTAGATATVNSPYIATITATNYNLTALEADSYSVTLYVGGVAVATAEAPELASKETKAFEITYVPHAAGENLTAYIELAGPTRTVTTEEFTISIAEESLGGTVAVGSSSGSSYYSPIYWYDADATGGTYCDVLYTAEEIKAFGIENGNQINSITFKGSVGGGKSFTGMTLNVWVAQQSATDFEAGNFDKTKAALFTIYDNEDVEIKYGEPLDTKIDMSASPIIWDGTSAIRVYTEIDGNGKWGYVQYAYDSNYKTAYYKKASTASWSQASGVPVAYVEYEVIAPVLSGTVKTSADAGIEGATVTLKAANGVQYSGTTGADGKYSFNVIQAGLDFTATVEAEGFLKKEFALPNMGGANATQDVVLFKQFGLVGTMPGFNGWDNDMVMTQSTENPNIFTLEMNNVEVTAGDYEFKLRADGAWNLADGYYKPNFNSGTDEGNGYTVSGGNYQWNFATSGIYNFLFTFDLSTSILTFERPFTLSETNTADIADLNWVDVTVEREFKAGWNAVVLPFGLDDPEFVAAFGANSEVAVYDGDSNDNGDVTVKFKKQDAQYKWIEAGVPYLIWLEQPVSGLKFTKNISATLTTVEGGTFDFVGTYTTADANTGDYFIQGGKFVKATTGNTVKPFRSYLKLKEGQTARSLNFVVTDGEGETTGIDAAKINGLEIEGIYNLNGQKVTNLNRKGIYIINGKKVMVK